MQTSRAALIASGVLYLALAGCKSTMPIKPEPVDIAVEHLLWAIDEAAAQSYTQYHQLGLELSSIEVALETIVETTDSGEVAVLVVTLEGSRERTYTQIVTVDLKPPAGEDHRTHRPTIPHPSLVADLRKGFDAAILATQGVQDGLQALDATAEGETYTTSDIAVELEFALEYTLEGSVTVELLDVDLTLGRTRVKENVHTIKLVFKPETTVKKQDEDEDNGGSKARERRQERDG